MSHLDDILGRINTMTPDQKAEAIAMAGMVKEKWIPNPGPQTEAYFCEADEILYGGQAGGGKTDLLIGKAINQHRRSLILRRFNDDARDLARRAAEVIGHDNGLNRSTLEWHLPSQYLEFGGCQREEDKQRYKGRPHDLKAFDELSDFTESQYLFITNWTRSAGSDLDEASDQKCQIIGATNPPTSASGLWIVKRWAAWLDPTHHNPAKSGEIRWFVRDENDRDVEVEGPGEYDVGGDKPVAAKSRTFIRSTLSDNPYLLNTDYAATLDQLPLELRAAYRDGRFDLGLKDAAFQMIPTSWVLEAQRRWTPQPPDGVPMCALGVDCTGGGEDPLAIAPRYDGWFAPIKVVPGKEIPMDAIGRTTAGHIFTERHDQAIIVLDMGGGYGGPAYEHLKDNLRDEEAFHGRRKVIAWKGSEKSTKRSACGQYGFYNKRTEAIWRFREALDPSQEGGSSIALPDDPELVADLTAPTFDVVNGKIKAEPKDKVCARIGRSTNKGDAVVMAQNGGDTLANIKNGKWPQHKGGMPKVNVSHSSKRRR